MIFTWKRLVYRKNRLKMSTDANAKKREGAKIQITVSVKSKVIFLE